MLQAFLPLLSTVVDSIFPNKGDQASAKIKLIELQQTGQFKEAEMQLKRDIAQIELNTVEASSDDKFKSRWRPFIGWVCGFGLAYATIIYPLLTWVAVIYDVPTPPNLDTAVLLATLGGLLGLGGYRTYEKRAGLTK